MIQVVYHRKFHRMTMEGHAESAEPGQDLVCASASILAYTLAANVMQLTKNGDARVAPVVNMAEGKTEIHFKPHSKYRSVVTMIFDSICAGFALLAHNHPAYIKFEIRE